MPGIRLIAGLGNPGPRYQDTRHNVGARWVQHLAARHDATLREERRFKGETGRARILGRDLWLLLPTTFMNLSGESVGALARFYRIEPSEILVAYDEVAFDAGMVRLKTGGGANGHNGVKSIIDRLGGNRDFHRLRIGVGRPGDASRMTGYLTGTTMPGGEREAVELALDFGETELTDLLDGQMQKFMNAVHQPTKQSTQDEGS